MKVPQSLDLAHKNGWVCFPAALPPENTQKKSPLPGREEGMDQQPDYPRFARRLS
jgi:hypothetical protein